MTIRKATTAQEFGSGENEPVDTGVSTLNFRSDVAVISDESPKDSKQFNDRQFPEFHQSKSAGSKSKAEYATHVGLTRQEHYSSFRRICSDIKKEIERASDFIESETLSEAGLEVVVEIEYLLEQLYDCPWGEGEYLKRFVVNVQSQVNNANWTAAHIGFLRDAIRKLSVTYVIDDSVIRACSELIDQYGLDQFRGIVSSPEVRRQYRIVEVAADE